MVKILDSVSLGSTIAEQDTLLYEARVETSTFTDLFRDQVDLIPGTKGSGKTALYRLISEYLKPVMMKSNIAIITGVEAAGDPVFLAFKKKFEQLTELEFENFWRIYFAALILEKFIKNDDYASLFDHCRSEVAHFKNKCREYRIPENVHGRSFRDIVETALKCITPKYRQCID